MRTAIPLIAAGAACVVLAHRPTPAQACGGCFAPPETITSVDSHRMVIALSAEKTTLWDQIRYTGAPEDFVWVLPVPTEAATIDVADPVFFDELEALTAPQIVPPPLPPPPSCPPPPDSWGAGSADAGAASPDAGVDVYREETVGPYQTVVIGSEDSGALVAWLNDHDYKVPDETLPVIDHYIAEGSKFIVLRLAPDQGVSAMQPVRVEYPGYMATFPLKMVTIGAWGTLELTLWVVSEQRYAAMNYGSVTVDTTNLVYDFAAGRSNYTQLFRSTIDAHGGKAWVTEYAAPLSDLWFSDYTEVQLAADGIPYPYVTRMRTDQLLEHLSEDLLLGPSADAGDVDNIIQVQNGINQPPPPQCPDYNDDGQPDSWDDYNQPARGGFGCQAAGGAGAGLIVLALAVMLLLRRRRDPLA